MFAGVLWGFTFSLYKREYILIKIEIIKLGQLPSWLFDLAKQRFYYLDTKGEGTQHVSLNCKFLHIIGL